MVPWHLALTCLSRRVRQPSDRAAGRASLCAAEVTLLLRLHENAWAPFEDGEGLLETGDFLVALAHLEVVGDHLVVALRLKFVEVCRDSVELLTHRGFVVRCMGQRHGEALY